MKKVDINVDIGEGFAFEEQLMDYATSANVCCGAHSGSWEITKDTVFLCRIKGLRIGMHPGFPDRESMGRAEMTEDEVTQYANNILEQAIRFYEYVPETAYVKPHGAWYNCLVQRHSKLGGIYRACRLMLDGVLAVARTPAMLLGGSPVIEDLRKVGEQVIVEGFAERAYEPDGTLRSRKLPGAVLEESSAIRAQVLKLAPLVDSICIHGDNPDCVQVAEVVYRTLEEGGFEVGF